MAVSELHGNVNKATFLINSRSTGIEYRNSEIQIHYNEKKN